MAIREGKWKCTYCGVVNRGRDVECVGCGAAREKHVTFFLEDDAPEVTDEAQLKAALAGPEWVCETCGASNPSARETCLQCGAPQGASVHREVREIPLAPPLAPAQTLAPEQPGCLRRWLVPVAAGGGALLLVALLLAFWATRTHEAQLTVSGVDWQRAVEVEELQTLTETAWEGEVPSDARVLRSSRELHHVDKVQVGTQPVTETYTERVQTGTKKVKVGVKDMGNGHFQDVYKDEPVYENQTKTRTVQKPIYADNPVYRNKITYQVDRWKTTRTAEAKGQDVRPAWPAVPSGPKVRAGKQTAKYVVHLADSSSGKTYDYEVDEDRFTRFAPGSVCRARINNFGSIAELDPPE